MMPARTQAYPKIAVDVRSIDDEPTEDAQFALGPREDLIVRFET
jgi:hypothetical protein